MVRPQSCCLAKTYGRPLSAVCGMAVMGRSSFQSRWARTRCAMLCRAASTSRRSGRPAKLGDRASLSTIQASSSAAGPAAVAASLGLVIPTCGPFGRQSSVRWPGHTLRQVQLLAELPHQLELCLQVVDVLLFVSDDLLQQDGAGAVLLLPAHDDSGLEAVQHLVFDRQIGLELLAD